MSVSPPSLWSPIVKWGVHHLYDICTGNSIVSSCFPVGMSEFVAITSTSIIRIDHNSRQITEIAKNSYCAAVYLPKYDVIAAISSTTGHFVFIRPQDLNRPIVTTFQSKNFPFYHMIYSPKSDVLITAGSDIRIWNMVCDLPSRNVISVKPNTKVTLRSVIELYNEIELINPPCFDYVNEYIMVPRYSGFVAYDLDGHMVKNMSKLQTSLQTTADYLPMLEKESSKSEEKNNNTQSKPSQFNLNNNLMNNFGTKKKNEQKNLNENDKNKKKAEEDDFTGNIFVTYDPKDGVCEWTSQGTLKKRHVTGSSNLTAIRLINHSFFLYLDVKLNIYIGDMRTSRLFLCGTLPEKPLSLVLYKNGSFIGLIASINTQVYFYQVVVPWNFFALSVLKPASIRLYQRKNRAARIVVQTSNSDLYFISPKTQQPITSASSNEASKIINNFYDRGLLSNEPRDQLFLVLENGSVICCGTSQIPCEIITKIDIHASTVLLVTINKQLDYCVATQNGEIILCDYNTFQNKKRFIIQIGLVKSAQFDSMFETVLMFYQNEVIRFDLINEVILNRLPNTPCGCTTAIGPGIALIGYESGKIAMISIKQKELTFLRTEGVSFHSAAVTGFAFGKNFFVSVSLDQSMKIWSFEGNTIGVIFLPLQLYGVEIFNGKRDIVVGTDKELMMIEGKYLFIDKFEPKDDILDNYNEKDDELSNDTISPLVKEEEKKQALLISRKEEAKETEKQNKKIDEEIIQKKIAIIQANQSSNKSQTINNSGDTVNNQNKEVDDRVRRRILEQMKRMTNEGVMSAKIAEREKLKFQERKQKIEQEYKIEKEIKRIEEEKKKEEEKLKEPEIIIETVEEVEEKIESEKFDEEEEIHIKLKEPEHEVKPEEIPNDTQTLSETKLEEETHEVTHEVEKEEEKKEEIEKESEEIVEIPPKPPMEEPQKEKPPRPKKTQPPPRLIQQMQEEEARKKQEAEKKKEKERKKREKSQNSTPKLSRKKKISKSPSPPGNKSPKEPKKDSNNDTNEKENSFISTLNSLAQPKSPTTPSSTPSSRRNLKNSGAIQSTINPSGNSPKPSPTTPKDKKEKAKWISNDGKIYKQLDNGDWVDQKGRVFHKQANGSFMTDDGVFWGGPSSAKGKFVDSKGKDLDEKGTKFKSDDGSVFTSLGDGRWVDENGNIYNKRADGKYINQDGKVWDRPGGNGTFSKAIAPKKIVGADGKVYKMNKNGDYVANDGQIYSDDTTFTVSDGTKLKKIAHNTFIGSDGKIYKLQDGTGDLICEDGKVVTSPYTKKKNNYLDGNDDILHRDNFAIGEKYTAPDGTVYTKTSEGFVDQNGKLYKLNEKGQYVSSDGEIMPLCNEDLCWIDKNGVTYRPSPENKEIWISSEGKQFSPASTLRNQNDSNQEKDSFLQNNYPENNNIIENSTVNENLGDLNVANSEDVKSCQTKSQLTKQWVAEDGTAWTGPTSATGQFLGNKIKPASIQWVENDGVVYRPDDNHGNRWTNSHGQTFVQKQQEGRETPIYESITEDQLQNNSNFNNNNQNGRLNNGFEMLNQLNNNLHGNIDNGNDNVKKVIWEGPKKGKGHWVTGNGKVIDMHNGYWVTPDKKVFMAVKGGYVQSTNGRMFRPSARARPNEMIADDGTRITIGETNGKFVHENGSVFTAIDDQGNYADHTGKIYVPSNEGNFWVSSCGKKWEGPPLITPASTLNALKYMNESNPNRIHLNYPLAMSLPRRPVEYTHVEIMIGKPRSSTPLYKVPPCKYPPYRVNKFRPFRPKTPPPKTVRVVYTVPPPNVIVDEIQVIKLIESGEKQLIPLLARLAQNKANVNAIAYIERLREEGFVIETPSPTPQRAPNSERRNYNNVSPTPIGTLDFSSVTNRLNEIVSDDEYDENPINGRRIPHTARAVARLEMLPGLTPSPKIKVEDRMRAMARHGVNPDWELDGAMIVQRVVKPKLVIPQSARRFYRRH
ncbi:hypothetical protein TRFO_21771 [Tritrichomonas foetus]|uniref:Uncharacterized protein n=1 Tax=Tritrichomonas foetus TaxID=1144522 RepID=A0A1J4KD68_9EUKA|nr:hypothetical protein TRFO_21771 [Tritrichomonas foetus]|eukprot:OHT09369.1 hypothetical protein TRFO_21771 [Tritrichomonas foetus]